MSVARLVCAAALAAIAVATYAEATAPLAGPSAAPEPAAWSLMILGFGLAGSLLRRRRGSDHGGEARLTP